MICYTLVDPTDSIDITNERDRNLPQEKKKKKAIFFLVKKSILVRIFSNFLFWVIGLINSFETANIKRTNVGTKCPQRPCCNNFHI